MVTVIMSEPAQGLTTFLLSKATDETLYVTTDVLDNVLHIRKELTNNSADFSIAELKEPTVENVLNCVRNAEYLQCVNKVMFDQLDTDTTIAMLPDLLHSSVDIIIGISSVVKSEAEALSSFEGVELRLLEQAPEI